jgi:hypothetical protein
MKSNKWNCHKTMLINPELLLRGSSPTPGVLFVELSILNPFHLMEDKLNEVINIFDHNIE